VKIGDLILHRWNSRTLCGVLLEIGPYSTSRDDLHIRILDFEGGAYWLYASECEVISEALYEE